MIDYEVQRCTRKCAVTQRELQSGETFYSTLSAEGARVVRHDYSVEAWQGPPEGVLGWWKSQVPGREGKKVTLAPNEVMLELLEQLADEPQRQDMRYVLALLLVRRRVLRLEEVQHNELGQEVSVLYCPRREATYHIVTATPDDRRTAEIQDELSKLLFAKAT